MQYVGISVSQLNKLRKTIFLIIINCPFLSNSYISKIVKFVHISVLQIIIKISIGMRSIPKTIKKEEHNSQTNVRVKPITTIIVFACFIWNSYISKRCISFTRKISNNRSSNKCK